MAAGGTHIRDLVEHTLRASDPSAALRSLTVLREELLALERREVARALDAGCSFAQVARALGISRQAAHRRYRDLVGVELADPRDEPGGRGRMLVTVEARTAVQFARDEASRLGAGFVGSEHLLLGVLRSDDPRAAGALRDLGVTLEEARRHALPTLIDGAPPPAPPPPPVAEGPGGISPYARAVFEQSLREAIRRGDGYIGVEHLLLASIGDPAGGATRTLDALGVDPDAVVERLER